MVMPLEMTNRPMADPSLYLSGRARARILRKSLGLGDLLELMDVDFGLQISQEVLDLNLSNDLGHEFLAAC